MGRMRARGAAKWQRLGRRCDAHISDDTTRDWRDGIAVALICGVGRCQRQTGANDERNRPTPVSFIARAAPRCTRAGEGGMVPCPWHPVNVFRNVALAHDFCTPWDPVGRDELCLGRKIL